MQGRARLLSIVQSDIAGPDHIQQRGLAVVQPGYRARLVAVADPLLAVGRVDDLETGQPRVATGGRGQGAHV